VTDLGSKPSQIKSVGVIGGGLMGSGIATALILNGIPVVLKELNKDFLQAGLERIRGSYFFSLRLFCIKIEENNIFKFF
jgi:enoyl-CoA hydratase/3-hydroxyacyl-CoA dehydrogenase